MPLRPDDFDHGLHPRLSVTKELGRFVVSSCAFRQFGSQRVDLHRLGLDAVHEPGDLFNIEINILTELVAVILEVLDALPRSCELRLQFRIRLLELCGVLLQGGTLSFQGAPEAISVPLNGYLLVS